MKQQKTFGNKEEFAIECTIEVVKQYTTFGYIRFWIGEKSVGEIEQYCMLNIPVDFLSRSLNFTGQRQDAFLIGKSKEETLEIIHESLYGRNTANLSYQEIDELSKRYNKFVLSPGGGEAFDGYFVILLEEHDREHFIWQMSFGDDQLVKEVFLPKGTYQKVVTSFLEWFASLKPSNQF